MLSVETLKLFKMYLEKKQREHRTDFSKSAEENLAEYVLISITIDRVIQAIDYMEMIYYD